MAKSYKEIMPQITTFMFDVDGVLTDGIISVQTNGELTRSMNTKDGYALGTAAKMGYHICIISGGRNEGVRSRLENLGITDVYLGADNKLVKYNDFINKHNIKPEQILYMGDDIPDFPVMKEVGLATCPKDAVPEIQNISHYISQKKGGKGCVRDVIEQVLKVQGKWALNFGAKFA